MKKTIIALALITTSQLGFAQERLSRQEALDYAAVVGADVKQLQGTPIPSSVDLKQPVVLRDGEFGGMVLPEAKLSLETLAKAGDKITPIGQLWLLRLTPMSDGVAISGDKLRVATIEHDGETYKVPQCALGVRRTASGAMELLVFGKDKEPLLKLALKEVEAKQDAALDMDADRQSDSAEITLKVLGKYAAKFKVTEIYL
ncbi:MAG: hypothetical protein ACLQVX_15765 [Limisphaerales bacterium]